MRSAAVAAVLVAALVARVPAAANEYRSCMDAADAIDPKMRECQDQELGRQDRALNAAYASVLASVATTPDVVAKLRRAERAWISFKDADCDLLDGGLSDGSLDRIMQTDCIIDKTKVRVAELNDWKKHFDNQK